MNENKDINNIIIQYLENNISEDDKVYLLSWLRISKENIQYFNQIHNSWEASFMHQPNIVVASEFDKSFLKYNRKKTIPLYYKISGIVAILVVCILTTIIISQNSKPREITVFSENTKKEILLPDSTKVWLNANSSLKYPSKFKKDKREVTLVGEGFFDVVKIQRNIEKDFFDKLSPKLAELKDGFYVNLGIGIPTLVANYIPEGMNVTLQSENGLLGMGPFPLEGEEDADLINAGKQTITTLPGSAFFDSAMSFGMIRAGKVDLTVLGAMEVSQNGDIASWKIPGKLVKGMGGAMDLVASAQNIIVAMMHTNRQGESKLLTECSLPLTGINCVRKIVTDLAILEVKNGAFHLLERAPGISVEEIKSKTNGKLVAVGEIPEMQF